jgi:hypothetical protein
MGYQPVEPERPALRLTSTIIAVVLALSMAIFPISGARSAAAMSNHHHHDHGAVAHHAPDHTLATDHAPDQVATATDDCSGHKSRSGKQTGCCDMGVCHAFTAAPWATSADMASLVETVGDYGDEQVRGELSVRIDRPPRTA